ncbi:MAG TPA: hypothetical protein VNQ52_03475 [Microbacteriaceae bacterium]|nr:hypothetical protein [Microbacteriaceae bacterium]
MRSTRRRKARRTAKQASTGAAFAAGAILIGVVAGGGTYALWQDNSAHDAGVLVPADGEASLRFAVGDPASSTAAFSNLLPGESKTIPVLLENDGDFDLDIAATLTATTGSGYSLRLKLDDACTTSGFLSSPYLTDPALAISTPTSVGTMDDGATRKLCVQVTADSGIVPSSAMTFDVTISGDSGS